MASCELKLCPQATPRSFCNVLDLIRIYPILSVFAMHLMVNLSPAVPRKEFMPVGMLKMDRPCCLVDLFERPLKAVEILLGPSARAAQSAPVEIDDENLAVAVDQYVVCVQVRMPAPDIVKTPDAFTDFLPLTSRQLLILQHLAKRSNTGYPLDNDVGAVEKKMLLYTGRDRPGNRQAAMVEIGKKTPLAKCAARLGRSAEIHVGHQAADHTAAAEMAQDPVMIVPLQKPGLSPALRRAGDPSLGLEGFGVE